MSGMSIVDIIAFIVIPAILILVAVGIFYCIRTQKNFTAIIIAGAILLLIAFPLLLAVFLLSPPVHKPIGGNKRQPVIAPQPHVVGNQLLDSNKRPVRLIGANRSGTEYNCLHDGIFDG